MADERWAERDAGGTESAVATGHGASVAAGVVFQHFHHTSGERVLSKEDLRKTVNIGRLSQKSEAKDIHK